MPSTFSHLAIPLQIRSLLLAFIFTLACNCALAESPKLLPLSVQEQITALKKQNQEMREQLETLKQKNRQASPSRQANGAVPPAVVVTNGKDAMASVQSLKWAIEAMNGRR